MTVSVSEMQRLVHEGVPLAAAWGVEVLSAAEGVATLRLPHRDDLLRPGGTVSGPALMGLADVAMWVALVSLTGLVLIWFVKRRRLSGLMLAGACGVACYLIYLFLIP